jgi:hypothetical protein
MSTNFLVNYVLIPAVGVFLVGLGLYLYLKIYLRKKMIQSGQDWPIIKGTTIGARVKNGSSEGGDYYSPVVTYSYSVRGVVFIHEFMVLGKGSQNEAEDILNQILGKELKVHYNPKKPAQAFTDYDREERGYGEYFFSLLILFIGLLFLLVLATSK